MHGSINHTFRGLVVFSFLAILVAAITALPAQAREEIQLSLRSALEIPLKKKISDLRALKNDKGENNVRGSYFQRFVKVDDDTYQVTFHTRTASLTELVTERSLISLKRESDGNWVIADEKVERVVDGILYRGLLGDETFHTFDSFSFDREGIKVTAGKGAAWVNYWRGKPTFINFRAENMKYTYELPEDVPYAHVEQYLRARKDFKNDIWFEPNEVYLRCKGRECEEILASSFTGWKNATVSNLDTRLQRDYKKSDRDARENRKKNPMGGFRLDLRPEKKYWQIAVKKKGLDHWARLTYNELQPEEIAFTVTRIGDFETFGPVFSYYGEATRNAGHSPLDLERRPDANGLDYDVVGITGEVDLAVVDADTMNCDLTYKINVRRELDILNFAIVRVRGTNGERSDNKKPSLRVELMEDGEGNELTYIRRGATSGLIVLPKTAQPGDLLTIHVRFENQNSLYQLNPSYSYVSRSGWMPFVRFGDMIDEFDLTVRARKRYEILGVGHLESEKIEGDYRVSRFVSDSPVTFPTIIFGDYNMDVPKFKATKMDGTEIPVRIFADKTSMMSFSRARSREQAIGEAFSGIQEIRPDSLRPIAEQAANALNLFREVYGVDYPFGKLDLVNDPIGPGFYGQAPASIIYLGTGVFRGSGLVHDAGISKFKESVVAHEVAHQWWGSLITMGNGRNYWFVESLAEYSSALFIENVYTHKKGAERGRKAYLEKVEEWRRRIIAAGAMASVQDVDKQWSGGTLPGMARTAAIYAQGPYAFHILRETFGDEKFFAFLKRLAQELQGREIVTRDIQMVMEESFGGTMDWFFDQWIRGVGIPEYSFEYETRLAEDGTTIVQGTIRQRILMGPERAVAEGKTYRGIITITAIGKSKKEYPIRVRIEDEETPFGFKVPEKPVNVVLNMNNEMLAHDIRINDPW